MREAKRKQQTEEQFIVADCSDYIEAHVELTRLLIQKEIYGWESSKDLECIELVKRKMKHFVKRSGCWSPSEIHQIQQQKEFK